MFLRMTVLLYLQMLNWIRENRQEFLVNYTEIGHDSATAEELEEEHRNFESSCMVSKRDKSVIVYDWFKGLYWIVCQL